MLSRHSVVSNIRKGRPLTAARQRTSCLYEYLVQFDGATNSGLAEWVDEDDLIGCGEMIALAQTGNKENGPPQQRLSQASKAAQLMQPPQQRLSQASKATRLMPTPQQRLSKGEGSTSGLTLLCSTLLYFTYSSAIRGLTLPYSTFCLFFIINKTTTATTTTTTQRAKLCLQVPLYQLQLCQTKLCLPVVVSLYFALLYST